MSYIIAEISNCHMGQISRAKQLIRIAKESGADAVKGQAFKPEDMIGVGSMPDGFYKDTALTYDEYVELIEYGKSIGIPVFFTVLSQKLSALHKCQLWFKVHAAKFHDAAAGLNMKKYDRPDVIISMNYFEPGHKFKWANILYATDYMQPIRHTDWMMIEQHYRFPIGLSHHGQGVDDIINLKHENLPMIEKHFHLGEPIVYGGITYRDTLHGANPDEFEAMARALKN